MNYTIGTGTAVHAETDAYTGGLIMTRCGSELAKGSKLHATDAKVTCKRCISLHGIAHQHSSHRGLKATPAPAPVVAAPVVADKPKVFVRMCVCCQERHRADSRE